MAVLGLRFCARALSSCGKWGPLFIAMRGPLIIAASLVAEHRLQTRRLSNCGSRAQLLRGMWDLPRPGLEPVSPALAGRFSTTAAPGKPLYSLDLAQSWCIAGAQRYIKPFLNSADQLPRGSLSCWGIKHINKLLRPDMMAGTMHFQNRGLEREEELKKKKKGRKEFGIMAKSWARSLSG